MPGKTQNKKKNIYWKKDLKKRRAALAKKILAEAKKKEEEANRAKMEFRRVIKSQAKHDAAVALQKSREGLPLTSAEKKTLESWEKLMKEGKPFVVGLDLPSKGVYAIMPQPKKISEKERRRRGLEILRRRREKELFEESE